MKGSADLSQESTGNTAHSGGCLQPPQIQNQDRPENATEKWGSAEQQLCF